MWQILGKKGIATLTAAAFSLYSQQQEPVYCEIQLGSLQDLQEGQMKKVQVGDNSSNYMLVLKKKNNKIVAFSSECPHNGLPLDDAFFDGELLWCPAHAASFCTTSGGLIHPPGLNNLKKFEVRQQADGTYVALVAEQDIQTVSKSRPSRRYVKPDGSDPRTFVIVGGGYSAQMAAEQLRKSGFKGKILMISKEKHPPYDRTQLSKTMDQLLNATLREPEFYEELGIQLMLNNEVVSLDSQEQIVTLKNNSKIKFDKLLLASGSDAKVQDLNLYQSNKNVFVLRTQEDHEKLRQKVEEAETIIIIGGSYIGMEVAATIKSKNPEKRVIIFEQKQKPLSRVFGPDIAKQILELQAQSGVKVLSGTTVDNFLCEKGQVKSVIFTQNYKRSKKQRVIPADLVLLATGSQLNTKFIPQNLLNEDGAVLVNEQLQTNNPNIYAAGDIASFHSVITGQQEQVEH